MADITYSVYIDWDNDGSVLAGAPTAGEDVSARVLNVRTNQSWSFGRDTARSLSAVKPGSITVELNNVSKDYMPDNASSPLYGYLGPAKPILVKAVHSAVTYNLFWGFIDDYSIDPAVGTRSVTLTCIDALARLAQTQVTTSAYESIQTGAAIAVILDAAGWPTGLRDLDYGSSTLRYWCADGIDAWAAIEELVQAEGSPAIAYVDTSSNFVFRDRQHRKLSATSTTSQATFRDTGSEPLFSDPVEYNIGFRDLINSVDYAVEEREPGEFVTFWVTDSTFTVAAGETLEIIAHADDPLFDVAVPEVDTDYTLLQGTVEITLNRTSGKTFTISIFGTTAAYIEGMKLRSYGALVRRTFSVTASNPDSITKYGIAHPDEQFAPKWLSKPDAKAISDRIVALRGERLPIMSFTVKNANDTRKVQMLSRTISDRVTIVEAQTGTNHDHYIERVKHSIGEGGKLHSVEFGCERVQTTATQFMFDVAGAGFDQGTFGLSSTDDATTVFILDDSTSGHRLGTGKLAN